MTDPHMGPAADVESIEDALELIRARGLRVSTARRLVLEILFAASEPLSAEAIAAGLDGRLPRSDLASVYRNLETLEEVGLVRHFHLGHGPGLYALAARRDREYLVCESCRSVIEVKPVELDDVRQAIAERFSFQARFGHFPIVGLCAHCEAGEDAAPVQAAGEAPARS